MRAQTHTLNHSIWPTLAKQKHIWIKTLFYSESIEVFFSPNVRLLRSFVFLFSLERNIQSHIGIIILCYQFSRQFLLLKYNPDDHHSLEKGIEEKSTHNRINSRKNAHGNQCTNEMSWTGETEMKTTRKPEICYLNKKYYII